MTNNLTDTIFCQRNECLLCYTSVKARYLHSINNRTDIFRLTQL